MAAGRLQVFKGKLKRMWALRQNGANTRQMTRAAGTSSICYGDDVQGVSDSVLKDRRSTLARAAAPAGKGKNPIKTLYAIDGSSGTLDPAFDAHALPVKHWALAWWESWADPDRMQRAYARRTRLPDKQRLQWARAAGPIAALDISLARVSWKWTGAATFQDHTGQSWDCRKDPPASIVKAMRKAVRERRLRQIADDHPDLIPEASDIGNGRSAFGLQVIDFASTLGRLINGKVKLLSDTPEWLPKHASALLSTVANGQWTQARRFSVKKWGLTTDRCQLCLGHKGTQRHRKQCTVTTPTGGWSKIPEKAQLAWGRIGLARQELLESTGLLAVKVPRLEPVEKGTFKWYSHPPDVTREDLVWVIDGSALNSRWATLATFGFGIVVYSYEGDLVAWGGGVPPTWTDSASAAEAWALAVVTSLTLHPSEIITDCLGLVHTAERGTAAATSGNKQLARTWAAIAGNLDGDVSCLTRNRRLSWMPAHQAHSAIGHRVKSNGKTLTSLEWRANRLVDAIAKNESARGQAPQATVDLLVSATALVKHSAAQTGAATHFANNFTTSVQLENGTIISKVIRDVQEAPKAPARKKDKPAAPQADKKGLDKEAEESSDWDSDDERQAYGPNTKRSRKAAQRRTRGLADAEAVQHLLDSAQLDVEKATQRRENGGGDKLLAAKLLATAACSTRADGHAAAAGAELKASEPLGAVATAHRAERLPSAAASRPAYSKGGRNRPTRAQSCTTAKASAAALQALLSG